VQKIDDRVGARQVQRIIQQELKSRIVSSCLSADPIASELVETIGLRLIQLPDHLGDTENGIAWGEAGADVACHWLAQSRAEP
jgi:hypothetical protein